MASSIYSLPSMAQYRSSTMLTGRGDMRIVNGQEIGELEGSTPPTGELSADPFVEMPQLGATFVPGGFDDYQMPGVYAPAPQRVLPEQDLQRIENEAIIVKDREAVSPIQEANGQHPREGSISSVVSNMSPVTPGATTQAPITRKSVPTSAPANTHPTQTENKSPFPKVTGVNVPRTDDEQEDSLISAKDRILHSSDVRLQLAWAADSLNCVEVSEEDRRRQGKRNPAGVRPTTPRIEKELRNDAVDIISYLADQRHPQALFMRAKWQEFGRFGFAVNRTEAFKGYEVAAELGSARAEYRMGMLCEGEKLMEQALQHYENGVKSGDSAAMYRMGMMTLLGQHEQPRDAKRGLELIKDAANKADDDAPQSAYIFGMIIARDLPDITLPDDMVPWPIEVGRQYIEKAAFLGFAKAQLKMGQAYELCQLECDFNPALSLHYYALASKRGLPEAALGLSRWFLFGHETAFPKDERLAFQYAKQAADDKLANGEFAMGYYYEIGMHVKSDLREARKWYELAAMQGNRDARGRLDGLSQSKTLTKEDHQTQTLNRIKSQHGSQRYKQRPDRFKQQAPQMPTLSEQGAKTPTNQSPRGSPRSSPGRAAMGGAGYVNKALPYPTNDHSPSSSMNNAQGLAIRSRSTAPYPVDDHVAPLNLQRPSTTAPYPEEDMIGSRQPQMPGAMPYGSMRPSSAGRGAPYPQNNGPPRGRADLPSQAYRRASPAGGYRQPSPNARPPYDNAAKPLPGMPGGYRANSPSGRPPMRQGSPSRGNPVRQGSPNRGPPPGQFPMGAHGPSSASLGPGYGSSRNASGPPNGYQQPSPQGRSGVPPRGDSLGQPQAAHHQRVLSNQGRPLPAPSAMGLKERPSHATSSSWSSAAPQPQHAQSYTQSQSPQPLRGTARSSGHNPAPSTASAPPKASTLPVPGTTPGQRHQSIAHPDGKTFGTGPATFDEMGIGRGKDESECIIM